MIVAFAWTRIRGAPISASMPPGLRSAARFAGGPFSISIAIHLAIILALIIAVHETRARELIMITWEAGAIHPPESAEPLEFRRPMPELNTESPDDSPPLVDVNKVLGANSSDLAATPSDIGLDLGLRHFGDYLNLHPGSGGDGGGTFRGTSTRYAIRVSTLYL